MVSHAVVGEPSQLSVVAVFLLAVVPGVVAQTSFPHTGSNAAKATISVSQLRVPERAREEFARAVQRYKKNDVDGTMKALDQAIHLAPDFPGALSLRGYIELMTGRFEACEADLRQALQSDPHYGPAYLHMASLMNHLGRYDEALASLEKDERFQPGSWEVPFEMAKSFLGKHDYAHALDEVNRSYALGGDKAGTAVHFIRADALYGLKQYEQAGTEIEAFLRAQPTGTLASMARELQGKIETREPAEVAKK